MEEENCFLTIVKQSGNREVSPWLIWRTVIKQRNLVDRITGSDRGGFGAFRNGPPKPETPKRVAYIRALLNSGVDAFAAEWNLRLYNRWGQVCFPLHMAVTNDMPQVTKLLLEHEGHPNVTNVGGWTAAHVAAASGSVKCLKILIAFGADVNATTKRYADTVKIDSILMESLAMRVPELKVCCNHHQPEFTPLHLAVQGNHLQCVRLLLDHGAKVNAMDTYQRSPFNLAATWGHPECLMMLLQHSGNCPAVFTPTCRQSIVLIQCFEHGEKMRECIKELVYRGADVSYHNVHDDSAVHKAVAYNWDLDMMKLLILEGHGMDFDRAKGGSPLMVLMKRRLDHYRGVGRSLRDINMDESKALLFLRMGATRKELKVLLWCELNLPNQPGVLLETLMDSFSYLPSLSELEAERTSRSDLSRYLSPERSVFDVWACSGTLWHCLERGLTEEAKRQEKERLKAIVAEKKRYYDQRSRDAPSLLHLSRATTRSNLQTDVRKVISWPVLQCVKRYILLDHVQ